MSLPRRPRSSESSAWPSRSAACRRWTASAFTSRRARSSGWSDPNGAGKTTTINMILGVLEPSAGRIEIEGVDLAGDRSRALSSTNFAAVYAPLPGNLTVEQNLRVFGMIYAVEDLSARIERLLHGLRPRPLPEDQGGAAVVGRADAAQPGQGDAEPPAAAAARRADRLDRSVDRARHPRRHRQIRRQRALRGAVDQPQHVRGPGGLRPGAVPVARPDRARRRSEDAARGAWRGESRRPVRQRRARGAARTAAGR